MFYQLFLKECKQILKSLTYYLIILCLVLFYVSQVSDFEVLIKPTVNQTDYGSKYSEDKEIIMKESIKRLAYDYAQNIYTAYPIGFYKEVTLSGKKLNEMSKILDELIDTDMNEIPTLLNEYIDLVSSQVGAVAYLGGGSLEVSINRELTYERFLERMDEVNDLIGGGSDYHPKSLHRNAIEAITYEEALQAYEDILYKDKLSNAYARIFCDYLGIIMGILPVFLAVTRGLRDKRTQVTEVVYSKSISSYAVILSRYLSTVLMLVIPILLLSISPTLENMYYGNSLGVTIDAFAYIKHIFAWIVPTILYITAIGFLITELTDSAMGILLAAVVWIISVFMSFGNLVGDFSWKLIPRFNTVGSHDIFKSEYTQFITNRLFYSAISIAFIMLTIYIYSKKRKGEMNLRKKIYRNRKSELS